MPDITNCPLCKQQVPKEPPMNLTAKCTFCSSEVKIKRAWVNNAKGDLTLEFDSCDQCATALMSDGYNAARQDIAAGEATVPVMGSEG